MFVINNNCLKCSALLSFSHELLVGKNGYNKTVERLDSKGEVVKHIKSELSAFTLAEVLLVLSVIGVVAALTIPALIQKVSNDQYVAKLKKVYSVFSQAYNLLLVDNNGDISPVFSGNGMASDGANAMNSFATKLNVIKNCGSGMGCWYDTEQKFLNGSQNTANLDTSLNNKHGKVILADGSIIYMSDYSGTCTTDRGDQVLDGKICGIFYVDINGNKPPNTRGRDFFGFWITTTGVYPIGIYNDGMICGAGTDAATSECTSKVLQEGAMNY